MRESDQQKLERLAATENALCREAGRRLLIAGMDEVGRGPLAGPVVTACVCLDLDNLVLGRWSRPACPSPGTGW